MKIDLRHVWAMVRRIPVPTCVFCGVSSLEAIRKHPENNGDGPCPVVAAGPRYRCTREGCGRNELDAREHGCKRGPCPMEPIK